VTVGANQISGVSFSVDDPKELYNEARKLAFADAREKAELYADAAGVELGGLSLISELTGYNQPPMPYAFKAEAAMDRSVVPVEVGQLTFSIDVNVSWNLE
jgi:uncharacterized protein YggE